MWLQILPNIDETGACVCTEQRFINVNYWFICKRHRVHPHFFLLVASVDTKERQKTTICMYSTACFSTTYHEHALSTEAQDKRRCPAALRDGKTACSVLGLSRSGDKRVPSPPLWLQTNVSSSAPGVTYINSAPIAPHLDAEQRIRHHNHSLQTAERVEAWLLYHHVRTATALLRSQPSGV